MNILHRAVVRNPLPWQNTWLLIKLDYWNMKAVVICTPLRWFCYQMARLNDGCLVVVSKKPHDLRFTHVLGIVTINCWITIKADWVCPELSWLQLRYIKNYSYTRWRRSVILFHLFWRNGTTQLLTIDTFIEVMVTAYLIWSLILTHSNNLQRSSMIFN